MTTKRYERAFAPDGSVLAFDYEEGAAPHPCELRLLARQLEARRQLLGNFHALGELEPDRALCRSSMVYITLTDRPDS